MKVCEALVEFGMCPAGTELAQTRSHVCGIYEVTSWLTCC